MNEKKITKENVKHLLLINKAVLPLSATFWKIETLESNKEKIDFYFTSVKHMATTLIPVNFYKPIISVIDFEENENL